VNFDELFKSVEVKAECEGGFAIPFGVTMLDWFAAYAPTPIPMWWLDENKHKYSRQIESGKSEMDFMSLECDWRWSYASAMLARKERKSGLVRPLGKSDQAEEVRL
jgi:hypothetical protein